ncbi:MAG: isoleucine--tRNA ligase [Nitriliruptorales bacterium]|nr:isoleucine--tRNA ligase [Nitriliruptorales bacterium]
MTNWPAPEPRPSFPQLEQAVLAQWTELDVFARSLEQRADGPLWNFYEGPPTANGLPGTHHVESRTFKDVFPRYRTMKGHRVPRKAGWDCHGLPVEIEIEKELGLDSKADIEAYGIGEFNERCRESVTRYVDAWEKLTERIGFWVDLDDAYWTMDPAYVDSLWWALKTLWDADLIFEDFRSTPYCARCGTGLSDAEVAQGYETITDPTVTVRLPLTGGPWGGRGDLLIWTTTPWTLPANLAVAVGRDITYALVDHADGPVVVAADLVDSVVGDGATVLETATGPELVGSTYTPIFDFAAVEGDAWRVVLGDHVTTTDGTGLVHIAPAFGAEDREVGKAEDLPFVNPVGLDGAFTTGPWEGVWVKDADPAITDAIRDAGRLFATASYEHTYPFCWRCKRPLIYYAKPSWYIRTTARRDDLLRVNETIDWHPDHIKHGRFGNWLENNVDWALSRDRYWGTPLPFWRCEEGHVTVVGSRAELSERAGRDLSDLDPHRPFVDEVTIPCSECNRTAERIPDVADAWFDSGAMPFAQFGHPHQNQELFEASFPAQYICEAIDQTRGWFYTLLAEATLLFDTTSYETVLCLGHIVDEDGQKMSKSKGNILDPWELIDRHGADALRWLMLAEGNPWVNRRVGHHLLEDVIRQFLLTLWNTHVFFLTYAGIDGWDADGEVPPVAERPVMDRWILAELADVVETVDAALDRYDVSRATRRIETFVDDLSNWYVRRCRRRFWRAAADDPRDKVAAHASLHTCLATLAGLLAPFVPFVAERLWQDLVVPADPDASPSVHLSDFPSADEAWTDDELRTAMVAARQLVELGRQARNDSGVRVRQPLARALVTTPDAAAMLPDLLPDIADELNIKSVEVADGTTDLVELSLRPNFKQLGPVFKDAAPRVAEALRTADHDTARRVATELASGPATITVDGRDVQLTPDMVDVLETARPGWAVATHAGSSFALDTTLTPELELEGVARELVRAVNELRKEADLALDDRIALHVSIAPDELSDRLEGAGWLEHVAAEGLAGSIADDPIDNPDGEAADVDLAGHGTATISLRRT